MNQSNRPRRVLAGTVLPALAVLLSLALPASADQALMSKLEGLRQAAVQSYNERDWQPAAEAADAYVATIDAAELPRAGSDYALVAFIGGHARLELWKAAPETFPYDFEKDVLGSMMESLDILQDDPFFKHNLLGSAYFQKLKQEHFRNLEYENAAAWHMYKALLARSEELRDVTRDASEYTDFAKYLLQYINRCFEMARHSPVPRIYLVRVREACRLGFGSEYDDRFAQLYQVVGFDDGNTRAGVLWQTGLDLMNSEGSAPEEVLDTFGEAAQQTQGFEQRAEIYRQMADFASRQDGHDYKLKAVEYGRMAFRLDPDNSEIQVQYGTSLHVISYAHYTSGRFDDALDAAREATSFEWEGDEVAFFDLSRSQANFGDKINALRHAEKAYQKARKKYGGAELQPFQQNYVNILRQFGLSAKAAQIEQQGEGS
jgi:hypothetical protein